jgi:hypothetical protein
MNPLAVLAVQCTFSSVIFFLIAGKSGEVDHQFPVQIDQVKL